MRSPATNRDKSKSQRLARGADQSSSTLWADTQFVRANQIARSNRNARPLIDISVATWWRWVSAGLAPPAIRLSAGTTVWRKSEVLAFIEAKHGK